MPVGSALSHLGSRLSRRRHQNCIFIVSSRQSSSRTSSPSTLRLLIGLASRGGLFTKAGGSLLAPASRGRQALPTTVRPVACWGNTSPACHHPMQLPCLVPPLQYQHPSMLPHMWHPISPIGTVAMQSPQQHQLVALYTAWPPCPLLTVPCHVKCRHCVTSNFRTTVGQTVPCTVLVSVPLASCSIPHTDGHQVCNSMSVMQHQALHRWLYLTSAVRLQISLLQHHVLHGLPVASYAERNLKGGEHNLSSAAAIKGTHAAVILLGLCHAQSGLCLTAPTLLLGRAQYCQHSGYRNSDIRST
jgi:hypothetical protein